MALYKSTLHKQLDCFVSFPLQKKLPVKLEKEQRNTTRMTKYVGSFPYKQLLNDWGISEWKRCIRNVKKKKKSKHNKTEQKYGIIVHDFLLYKA